MLDVSSIHCAEKKEFVKCVAKLAPNHMSRIQLQLATESIYMPSTFRYVKCYYAPCISSLYIIKTSTTHSKELLWAVNNTHFHDVVFVVGDGDEKMKRFVAHKVVLCANSPYFTALLTGGLKV